ALTDRAGDAHTESWAVLCVPTRVRCADIGWSVMGGLAASGRGTTCLGGFPALQFGNDEHFAARPPPALRPLPGGARPRVPPPQSALPLPPRPHRPGPARRRDRRGRGVGPAG